MAKKAEEEETISVHEETPSGKVKAHKIVALAGPDTWKLLDKARDNLDAMRVRNEAKPVTDIEAARLCLQLALDEEVKEGWHLRAQINLYGWPYLIFEGEVDAQPTADELFKVAAKNE